MNAKANKRKGHVIMNACQRMNAIFKTKQLIAMLILCAMVLCLPLCAAADTAPLVPGAQEQQHTGEHIGPFGHNRSYLGVTASKGWKYQARLGGVNLNLRLFSAVGERITFQEKVSPADTGKWDIRLNLAASVSDEPLVLQLDQTAVDILNRLNVTEIVVADNNSRVVMRYLVSDLEDVRTALGLGDLEQLCVSGENDPVTVVSEDGVRRQATP